MNIFHINKSYLIFLILFFLNACTTKNIYEKVKIKKYNPPIIENFDSNKIKLNFKETNKLNYENKLVLNDFKNYNIYLNNVLFKNEEIFAVNNKNQLLKFNNKTGDLISSTKIQFSNDDNDNLVSLNSFKDTFIISYKSGTILRINKIGEILWIYKSDKILNTPLVIINEQIIALFNDQIQSLSIQDGSDLWYEIYSDLPVYQAKGGQIVNFFNLLFYILPNNKIGAFDTMLGSMHISKFDEIQIMSSLNNTKDKIYIFEDNLIYLDEGKYLYTFNIIDNEFNLYKKNINLAESNIFYNNSIILKNGNHLQAINIKNGNTFWLINDKDISKNSSIIAIRNYNAFIEIFLSNGDVLEIKDKKLIKINNLDVGKIIKISFEKNNIIVHTESKKTVIF